MKIKIIAIGDKLPDWLESGIHSFHKRFSHPWDLSIVTISPAKRSKTGQAVQYKQDEWDKIKRHLQKDHIIVALDEHGKHFTTRSFSEWLVTKQSSHRGLTLLVGGPDGLAPECLDQCHQRMALSSMTLPHGIARLLIVEQLYRAISLIQHHPYHRD